MTKHKIFIVAGVLLVAVIAVVFFFFNKATYSASYTPYDALLSKNPTFAQAESAYQSGDYQAAQTDFNAALSSAQDSFQQADIALRIASAMDLSGDHVGAVDYLKGIVANPSYDVFAKAYSIQNMASMPSAYPADAPAIMQEIFKDPPYSGMFVATSTTGSILHLYQYAASFYPLAISELHIAQWYAQQLQQISTTTPQAISYMNVIQSDISAANVDITRTEPYTNSRILIPEALMDKAVVEGQLALVGMMNAQDADAAFQTAIASFATYDPPQTNDSYARYNYAVFLAQMYGSARAGDITSVLAPLSTSGYAQSPAVAYLKSLSGSIGTAMKNVQLLAQLDPNFKTYLISLGWHASDF